ncbi:MAG TPA: aminopeptidase P family protein [Methylibium sp.]|uniref:aminopeptidase P family protein n=1 Tax=Methylibium sp. TaxID=2067992 RepID=UPI002DB9A58F|nr:aminopeptidase P family protein [Methylibium sp.]HEU4457726.1 aminopeptidase P family protein [Methylibium sp.]
MDTRTSPIRLRLDRLREAMRAAGHDAVLLPSSDPHLSEYLPAHWQGREWFSGFTGSVATLVVLADRAALFADSRYWSQAESQLAGSGIELVKLASVGASGHLPWLAEQLRPGQTLAVDAAVLALDAHTALKRAMDAAGVKLLTDADPLAAAWPERPALPAAAIYEHRAPHAATARADKLAQLRAAMAERGATHHWISTLDDLAWLTNLRGADVDYNPVFLGHALLSMQTLTLFVDPSKLDASLVATLARDGVAVRSYAEAAAALAALPREATLLIDPKRITLGLRQAVPPAARLVEAINPSTLAKSRKTDAEAAFVREAMARDGAAMCAFYAWFEAALGREAITELTVAERLSAERAKQPDFVSLSFPVIAGFNANGALPHYRASADAHAVISRADALAAEGLLLIDSGGQYLGGTTDITRVWPIGSPTAEMKRDYTLVLKGTIALSRMRFPRGTPGPMLDAIARAPLWAESLDFGHGTGHGVGYFLNVHEGPQTISRALPAPETAMQPGMITSIEPGLYRPGRWGVRIENLVLNVPAPADGFGEFLAFETLSLCPIDTRCIERSLLRDDEVAWLDAYHATVRQRLAPLVRGGARDWLEARTRSL